MGTEQKQHAIRRSTRLPLEIPVLVASLDPALGISDQGKTTLVNAHGCGLILERAVPNGIRVRLEIPAADRHTVARVAEVVPLGGEPETWLLGLELDYPGNFWGIEYAPSDWKIDEPGSPAVTTSAPPAKAETKAAMSPKRWRLTDISGGGCYLETTSPMPAGTPVLISVRIAKSEWLLDGIVRASHANSGIGVEFLSHSEEHRQRVEELIGQLLEHREVPRILVGRKEGAHNFEPRDSTPGESDVQDPLLELLRRADSLSAEQFLANLQAQRLGKRSEPRKEVSFAVLLAGTDTGGRPLDQRVTVLNVSKRGALLAGLHGRLRPGDTVHLTRANRREPFRVAWVGGAAGTAADQVGVVAVESQTSFWDDWLRINELPGETASVRSSEKV